ncbi:Uncharacterised protein [Halioglobus japonicus]|nr:Uncharacterised protein [Halioglobus japonicus]
MNSPDILFTVQDFVRFQMMLKQHLIGAAKAPLIGTITGLQALVLGLVIYVEYEIIYRVFEFLSGDNDYWSPGIMGLTAAIMIIGFHLQAKIYPTNFAARFVNRAVQYLVPLYMLGVGLLVASILDVGSLIQTEPPVRLGKIPDEMTPTGIEAFFTNVTNPLAALTFSLGLGGLAVVNIFVAHHLLNKIWRNIEELTGRLAQAKQAIADYAVIKRTHQQYAACVRELADVLAWDDKDFCMTVAGAVLLARDEALRPHKEWLAEQRLGEKTPFDLKETASPNEVAKMIKPLEAISQDDILNALTPPKSLENRR